MAKHVFFSWQSDTPNKVGRSFLKDILEEVCASMASDTTLDEVLRDVAVDSDTQGVAGQPPIVETIFKKIDATAVFIADMTFTGRRIDGRPTPNPNVLIEYGWALKSLTNERVICVMNTAYGEPTSEDLPFDLAHLRWPIRYNLPDNASAAVKAEEKRKLSNTLKDAIRASLATVSVAVIESPPVFSLAQAKDGPARFRDPKEALGFEDDTFGENNKEIFLSSGPAMWLRLMPITAQGREWATRELKKIAMEKSYLLPLIHPAGGYSYLRESDGEGMYRAGSEKKQGSHPNAIWVDSVAFAFRTGEVWSIETALLAYDSDKLFSTEIEEAFVKGIKNYSLFLKEIGIDPPYYWKAGLIGVRGRRLGYPPQQDYSRIGPGPVCASDRIEAEGQIDFEEREMTALLPFFKKIFDECGIERPEHLPQ